jgi:hypothetical protein
LEEFVPCPIFARYTLAFTLQLTKKNGKPSLRVGKTCQGGKTSVRVCGFFIGTFLVEA